MAKRKIIWSHRAKIKRLEILEFYVEKNKSNVYSKKLNERINKELQLLKKFPNIGLKTEIENVRGLFIENFILFYEINNNLIIIHYMWDSRQDPGKLKIK